MDATAPTLTSLQLTLNPLDNERLAAICGPMNQHLRQIEERLNITIAQRADTFTLSGPDSALCQLAKDTLATLYQDATDNEISADRVHHTLQDLRSIAASADRAATPERVQIRLRRMRIDCRNPRQIDYVRTVQSHDLTFGVGPAGTGKTYLAVAAAVEMLEQQRVRRLVLVRPAVEAGEKLGFLPGDMAQKVDPYLRPIYDALYEFLGFDQVAKLIERQVIEIAPLAFMRGRTLNHACIIMDEAQNTTVEQMKMFLTRIGFGSTAIVTGDGTQVDLPKRVRSGLAHVLEILRDVEGVGQIHFGAVDVVRHPLVQRIVQAYELAEHSRDTDARE